MLPAPLLVAIPLICLKVKSTINSFIHLLTLQTLPQLKAVSANGGELGKLSDAICGLVEENMLFRTRFSELRKSHLDHYLHFDDLSEWLPCATFIINKEYRICNCNKNALSMFGYDSLNQLISRNFLDFISDSKRSEFQLSSEGSQSLSESESVMLRRDGIGFIANMYVLPDLRNEAGEKRFFIFIKQFENETENQIILTKQSSFIYNIESLSRLAGGIAHDFNNILGAISGYAEIIYNKYSTDNKLIKYSKMIQSASRRGSALSEKLLQFARKNKIVMSSFNVNDSLAFLKDIFTDSEFTIQVKFHLKAQDSFILGDIEQFRNALTNIAMNAQETMPDGGEVNITTKNVTIENSSCSHLFAIVPGYYVAILISDSGTCINKQDLSHMFEPFYTSKDRSHNTGLGLACAYGIIKRHNGFIDVESAPGKGTTFTLYFPVYNVELRSLVEENMPANKRILLVDDELMIREAIGETLSWLGFSVSTAESGDEAIKMLQEAPQSYDLIILDMIMPGMSGKDCIVRIKELKREIKILISSGFSEEMDQTSLIEMGVSGILVKPFESAQLSEAIYEALG